MKSSLCFKNEIFKYLLCAFALTWLVWGILLASVKGVINSNIYQHHMIQVIIIGGSIPSILAILYVWILNGKTGLKHLLQKLLIWKINPLWYVFSICYMYAIYYVPAVICNLFGNYFDFQLRYSPVYLLYLFAGQLFAGPINEEFGWRGFVLPRLQCSLNPLAASILLGIIHALWHLPLFFIYIQEPFGQYLIKVICISIIYTWMYNHTKGSLIPVCLLHANYNFLSVVFIMTTIRPATMYLVLSNGISLLPIIFISWYMLRYRDKKVVV